MAAQSCALLEANARLFDAASCYTKLAVESPTSSSASCSFVRVRRLWLDSKRLKPSTKSLEAATAKWRALSLQIGDDVVPRAGGGAAWRCAAEATNTSEYDALRPPPKKDATPAHIYNSKAVRLTEEGRNLAANGRLADGRARLISAVAADPSFGLAHLWLGVCESHMGMAASALERLATAEKLLAEAAAPDERAQAATAAFERGNLLYHGSQHAEAEAAYHRAVRHNPKSAEAYSNLGVLSYTSGRHQEAAQYFEAAIKAEPQFADAHMHLGAVKKAMGDAEGALASYKRSAKFNPTASEPLRGMALVLRERGRLDEALDALKRGLKLAPSDPQLYLDRGITHDYAERREEAMAAYEAAARLTPSQSPNAWKAPGASTAKSAMYLHGRAAKSMALWKGWDGYQSWLRRTVREPGGAAALSVDPVASLSAPFTGPELLNVVTAAAAAKLTDNPAMVNPDFKTRPARQLRRGGERLTIGFVSSYFRDHNLLRLTRSLFTNADNNTLRFVLFAESDDDRSPILRRTQSAADAFVRIRDMSTPDATRAMASHGLHIAINLNGHHWNSASETVRFALFGKSSSPVTAAYMGYPGPTGAPNLQYTYVDAYAVPPANEAHFTERFALLPHTYYLNDYARAHADVPRGDKIELSADHPHISKKCLYLCNLNQLPKLDPRLYSAWLNALRRASSAVGAPCTRLWMLKFPAAGEAMLRREAQAHASPPTEQTLLGLPTVTHANHLRRAQHCDLKLDSTLCNAHTSGTDALWAGTPMLTLPGETQTSRVALSLLNAVGQPQIAVRSMREFEEMAVTLAADVRAARRASLYRV